MIIAPQGRGREEVRGVMFLVDSLSYDSNRWFCLPLLPDVLQCDSRAMVRYCFFFKLGCFYLRPLTYQNSRHLLTRAKTLYCQEYPTEPLLGLSAPRAEILLAGNLNRELKYWLGIYPKRFSYCDFLLKCRPWLETTIIAASLASYCFFTQAYFVAGYFVSNM